MNYKHISLALLLLMSNLPVIAGLVMNLNRYWRYTPGYELRKGVYEKVNLPHTWNTGDALGGNADYYRGLGNYERNLEIPAAWKNKRLFLKFYGVNTIANVFINGQHVGEHRGGYTSFTFEITNLVRPGEHNTLQVRVNNAPQLDIMPLLGDFNMYGGIYRDVELLIENPNCISPLHYGSEGIYLKPKQVNEQSAQVEANVHLNGQAGETLKTEITVRNGEKVILKTETHNTLDAQGQAVATIPFSIHNPRLWNGQADPFMYAVELKIYHNSDLQDDAHTKLGLRYFRADAHQGFFLNGNRLQLKGVCRHQDRPELGNALNKLHHEEDIAIMQDMGANAVRLSHYPQDPYVYKLLDEAGFIVWSEIPFVGPGGYRDKGFVNQESFKENGRQQLKEMIYQQFNHPSICFWGLFNELKEEGDNPVAFVQELNQLAKELDPLRLTTAASNQGGQLNRLTETIAWNKYYGWYGGTPASIGQWADKAHKEFPNTPIGISEYGAGASIYHQQEELKKPVANSYWHPENWQTHFHEQHWMAIDQRPFLWGTFIWNLFDFGAAHRTEGEVPGKNDKGLITFDRAIKKDAFYFYKANWNTTDPLVYFAERRLDKRSNTQQTIKVYSNQKSVELTVNGQSLGRQKGHYGRFIWENISLKPGKNILLAKAKSGTQDKIVIRIEDTASSKF
ncbi:MULTISPECIES: beta-glucuronidase LacZ4 [unclassified Carboxylicivirga]|uniref:beta-glucuronidase LacZ4 n=1 Tax=Carboxylicivirga TaxID=1628153 RepID=UPI003D355811